MDQSKFEMTLQIYFAAFAEQDYSLRHSLLSQCLTEDAEIWGPQKVFKGVESISEKIEGFHERMPGARLVLTSGLYVFQNVARFAVAIIGEDGSTIAKGDAVNEFAEDGRIFRVLPFWDVLPSLPEDWPGHLVKQQ